MSGLKKALILIGSVLGIGLLILVFSWNSIAKYFIDKEFNRLADRWNGKVSYQNLDVSFLTVHFDGLYLSGNDTTKAPLITAKTLEVSIGLKQIFTGSKIPASLILDSASVALYKNENGLWNFSRKAAKIAEENPDTTIVSFPKTVKQTQWLLNRMLDGSFPDIQINRFSMKVLFEQDSLILDTLNLKSDAEKLSLSVHGPTTSLHLNGTLSTDSLVFWYPQPFKVSVAVTPTSPFTLSSDSGYFSVYKNNTDEFEFTGLYLNFTAENNGLATGPVKIDTLRGNSSVLFNPESSTVTISTELGLNQFKIEDTLRYTETDGLPKIYTRLFVPPVGSKIFVNALPPAFLGPLEGLSWKGNLGYDLSLDVDFNLVDSLKLKGQVLKDHFSLISPGVSFAKLDSVFYQPVYDGMEVKREVLVGPPNPFFTKWETIPEYLKKAVLTNEDGAFLFHRGFNEEAFQGAFIENIKSKKFRRGASTISMQFVKNVYLNRKKTLARKFQELMITWLLENNRPVTKERMLEIYFNVIEWGPDVYGIGEAAPFYFKKKPVQLTLEESLYLAALVPSPKRFYKRFDGETLKPSILETMTFIARKMEAYKHIPEGSVGNLNFSAFKLTGPAAGFLQPAIQDTISVPEESEEEGLLE
ncbi:MAG: transglycosylase domain-containing protein [Bacteroidetes bacterium]|nr:transglycosylase domain-containing protein [Bacteroidota bacterium]